ncbi:hypothetical protein APHAL10511_000021 [Amanita phalloides]|nr:hypothetical protein APHAL10511_000021 [Amanita phalloides]
MSDYAGGFLEQELVEALRLLRAANYGIVASCTFLVYDVVLTMGREVNPNSDSWSLVLNHLLQISYIWR